MRSQAGSVIPRLWTLDLLVSQIETFRNCVKTSAITQNTNPSILEIRVKRDCLITIPRSILCSLHNNTPPPQIPLAYLEAGLIPCKQRINTGSAPASLSSIAIRPRGFLPKGDDHAGLGYHISLAERTSGTKSSVFAHGKSFYPEASRS